MWFSRAMIMPVRAPTPCPRGIDSRIGSTSSRVIDAAQAAGKAVSLGGRILVEPHEDRHGGKVAVIADPAGAPIGLMEWSVSESKAEPK